MNQQIYRRIYEMLVVVFLVAGCMQLPTKAIDVQAWKFEPVADKAVIYIVRGNVDAHTSAALTIGKDGMVSTHAGTYIRWEVAPGAQRIETFGASLSSVTVQAQAGKIYFVEHVVSGGLEDGIVTAALRQIDETRGQWLVRLAIHM